MGGVVPAGWAWRGWVLRVATLSSRACRLGISSGQMVVFKLQFVAQASAQSEDNPCGPSPLQSAEYLIAEQCTHFRRCDICPGGNALAMLCFCLLQL